MVLNPVFALSRHLVFIGVFLFFSFSSFFVSLKFVIIEFAAQYSLFCSAPRTPILTSHMQLIKLNKC